VRQIVPRWMIPSSSVSWSFTTPWSESFTWNDSFRNDPSLMYKSLVIVMCIHVLPEELRIKMCGSKVKFRGMCYTSFKKKVEWNWRKRTTIRTQVIKIIVYITLNFVVHLREWLILSALTCVSVNTVQSSNLCCKNRISVIILLNIL
jgi:hypothetical protein